MSLERQPFHERLGRRALVGVLTRGALGLSALACVACATSADEAAAQRPAAGRCALCGMRVTRGAAFSSGARTAGGDEVVFDSVKCMFRWLGQHADAHDPWTTEHLSRSERPARELLYVLGSDLHGPMGADLVAVDTREHAEQLRESHHGSRVLTFDEIGSDVVDGLFRM